MSEQPGQSQRIGDTDNERGLPSGLRIDLNPAFVEEMGEQRIAGYVSVITEVAARSEGKIADDVERELRDGMDRAGVPLADHSLRRLSQQIVDAPGTEVAILTDDGRVLHGAAADTPQRSVPDAPGPDDPGNPDRPAYT